MSWLEELAVNVFISLIHGLVKNPAKQTALRGLLLGIADDLYVSYGIAPPAHT